MMNYSSNTLCSVLSNIMLISRLSQSNLVSVFSRLFKRTLGFWFLGGALPSNRPMGDVPLDGVAFSIELLGWVAHFRPGFWDNNVPVIRDFKP